jgi:hypothetical protein
MIYGTPEFDERLVSIIKAPQHGTGYRHSCYQEACEHAEEMSWHFYGTTPDALLDRVRPREDQEVTKYRKDNYEPTTKSAADKSVNITSKIFNPNLSSIRFKNENPSAQKLKEYTLEYFPVYNSVVNYAKDVLLRKMLADPNGVIAVRLDKIPEKTNEEPYPTLVTYGSSCVWDYDYEHFLIFTMKEESADIQKRKITWYYFDYYDEVVYLEFRAYITPNHELVTEEIKRYQHNFNALPAWKLQGKSDSKDNGEILYKSFFDSAVPYWNMAIVHESDVLGAFINHIHPLMYEITENCNYVHQGKYRCRKGVVTPENGESFSCPECSGSGNRSMGAYGVKKISKDKLQEGDTPLGILPLGYIPVPTDATKMLEERADRMRKMGMWAINMDIEDEIGENQSGVAKVIDRSAQYDMLYTIGSVVFDVHLQNIFYFFNAYMFGVSDLSQGKDPDTNLPEINKPTQFDIASTAELISNYKVAKDSGLDPNFLQLKQIEIGTRDLTTNPDLKRFTNLLLDLDPLPGMDAQTVSLNVSRLFVRQVDAVIHFNIKRFLERAIMEDKEFFERTREEQMDKLEEYGEEMISQNKPVIDPNTLQYAQPKQKAPAQAQGA